MRADGKSERRYWYQRLTIYAILAVCLQGCSLKHFQQARPIADQFIQLLSSAQYARAAGMIDPKKQGAYPASYLAQRWRHLEQAVGNPHVTSLTGIYAVVTIDLTPQAKNNSGRVLRCAYEIRGPVGSYEVNLWLRHDGKQWRVWDVSIPSPITLPRQSPRPSPSTSDKPILNNQRFRQPG